MIVRYIIFFLIKVIKTLKNKELFFPLNNLINGRVEKCQQVGDKTKKTKNHGPQ